MASVGARRCGQDGARRARRHDRRALDEVGGALKERRARGSALARRRRVGSCEPARGRWRSSNEAEREDGVGRRSAVRPGRRTRRTTTRSARARRGRRRDQGTTCSRLGARSPSSCRLVGAGAGAMEEQQRELSVRMASVGARRCGQDGARGARRHDRRASTRSAARSRNDVLAARRALAVVVSARVSRRGGDGRAATKLSVRMASVGARRCGQDGARRARRHDRRALDEVGGALKERRARGSALARRRRVGSCEPARGAMEEQQRS